MQASGLDSTPARTQRATSPRAVKVYTAWIVNGLLYLTACTMIGTGLLLHWRLPPGSRGGRGLRFLGLGRHDWADLHTFSGYLIVALGLVHLGLHWAWLYRSASQRSLWRLAAGLGMGVAIIAFFLLWPL